MATDFIVNNAELVAPAIVRLTFSVMPLSASSVGRNDSTNRLNYIVNGPNPLKIDQVRTVKGDPFSVDLIGNAAFDIGQWVIGIQNIRTAMGQVLETPSVTIQVDSLQKFFSPGAKNQTGEDIIRQNLNPVFDGPGWQAYVAACGYSDQKLHELAEAAFFQSFLTTASDIYLEKLTSALSVERAPNTGMSDDTLRQLTIAVNANKVVLHPFIEVLKAYYGEDSVVTNIKAATNEPYALVDGDTLLLTVDDVDMKIVFSLSSFSNIGQATALEVAQSINQMFIANKMRAYATVAIDPSTGAKKVQIFAGRDGTYGTILVRGGTAEKTLLLPKLIPNAATTGVSWQVMTHTSNPLQVPYGRAWIRFAGGLPDPAIDLVADGDYIALHDVGFSAVNRGDFLIEKVGVYLGKKYMQVVNRNALPESPVQVSPNGIIFLDGTATSINGTYFASAIQPWPEQVDVLLPATAKVINRTEKTAAYINGLPPIALSPYDAVRSSDGVIEIGFPTDHGLVAGQFVQLQNFLPVYDRDPFQTYSYNTDISNAYSFALAPSVKLNDGRIFIRRRFDWVIFDPVTNLWTEYSDPSLHDRYAAGAALMADGRVLIVGGSNSFNTAEIYDPTFNAIAPTTPPGVRHAFLPQVGLLPNGTLYATDGTSVTDAIEVFNPGSSTWTQLSDSATGGGAMSTATVTKDGSFILIGGIFPGAAVKNVSVFQPRKTTFYDVLPSARYGGCALFVNKGPRGQIWYFGGYDSTDTAVDTVFVIDLATMKTVATYHLNYARGFGQIVPLPNGKFVLFGGTTLNWTVMPIGFSNGPPPEIIDPMALSDSMKFVKLAPEVSLNYETVCPVQMLDDGRLFIASPTNPIYHIVNITQQTAAGGMSGKFEILTVPTPDTITISTPEHQWETNWIAGQIVPVDATKGELQSGYLVNPVDGVTITSVQTTLAQVVIAGAAPPSILVSSVADIPDAPGYLVFSFGDQFQSKPIRYLGISGSQLRLDPAGSFESTYQAGTQIILLASKGAFDPSSTLGLGVFYLTASSAGRLAASNDIDSISGVGLVVNKTVLYPGDRGLGGQGLPALGAEKLSDKVAVWGGDNLTVELAAAREGESIA